MTSHPAPVPPSDDADQSPVVSVVRVVGGPS